MPPLVYLDTNVFIGLKETKGIETESVIELVELAQRTGNILLLEPKSISVVPTSRSSGS